MSSEVAAGAVDEHDGGIVAPQAGCAGSNSTTCSLPAPDLDKAATRRMRALDQLRADRADGGKTGKDDHKGDQVEDEHARRRPGHVASYVPGERSFTRVQMSRPSTFSVSDLISSGTRGRCGWMASTRR